jgi:tetratricopeptide (TPR) repeat protein
MAEEEKDEQVIVIEDLDEEEEDKPQIEEEQPSTDEEQESKEDDAEKPDSKPSESESLQPASSFLKNKKNLIIIGAGAVLIVIIAIILASVLFSKKEEPKKEPKSKKVQTIQQKPVKVKKKKISIPKKYNPIVDAHFINALRLQEKGDYMAAIKELKQASVDLYLSYYGIGYIYLKLGDIEKAKLYMIDKTKKYLLLSIENNPNYILGYINLFRVYMSEKAYKKAKQIIDVLKEKHISEKEIALIESYYNYSVNNDQNAIYNLINRYPNSAILNGLLGDIYLKEGDLIKAQHYFDKAIKPYVIGSLCYNKALIYVVSGDYKNAMRCISKSYYMDFDKIKCKNYLGFFLFLHERKLKAAYEYFSLNKQYFNRCYSHFKITPTLYYSISKRDYIERKNINYLLAAEFMNMYLKPIRFSVNGASLGVHFGELYTGLGLTKKAIENYQHSAAFAEAALITQKALKFYIKGNLYSALVYYKKALNKVSTDPILLYNVAIMYLKNHQTDKAKAIFERLESAYNNFPLPYIGDFIIKQSEGKHRDAIKSLKEFQIKLKSIPIEKVYKNMVDLGVFSHFLVSGRIDKDEYKHLMQNQKHMFLLIKSAIKGDLAFLSLEKEFERMINIDINTKNYTTILEYFNKSYKNNNFIKRALSDCYLFDKKYNEAYRAMFGIPQYSSEDYYKLGIAYLMSGFPEAADNFFTKSILKGIDIYNAYMAKAIMQAQKGDLKGILYYLKIMLKKDMSWLNTYIFLSFDLELK